MYVVGSVSFPWPDNPSLMSMLTPDSFGRNLFPIAHHIAVARAQGCVGKGVAVQIPAPFDYARATSVDDAVALLTRYGEDAQVVAGGHSLLPMMKLRLARPEWLIDVNDLHELDFIRRDGDWLLVGPLTRHRT